MNPCNRPISTPLQTCSDSRPCPISTYCHYGSTSETTICCPFGIILEYQINFWHFSKSFQISWNIKKISSAAYLSEVYFIEGNRCEQPVSGGNGTGSLRRWYYNPRKGTCEIFTYNGLHGNANNFLTKEDCESSCRTNPCADGLVLNLLNQIQINEVNFKFNLLRVFNYYLKFNLNLDFNFIKFSKLNSCKLSKVL